MTNSTKPPTGRRAASGTSHTTEPDSAEGNTNGPLNGIRVVDMTSVILGTFATQMLGDLGAEVIKIESPPQDDRPGGDIMRWGGTPPSHAAPGMGPLFMAYNRNKKSVVLDLSIAEGQQALYQLVRTADVFVSNIRYSSLKKLHCDYPSLREQRGDLVYAHAAGFGNEGPYAGLPAYDDLIQAVSGSSDLLPRTDGNRQPRYLPALIADKTTALYLAHAITAALFQRERTGRGQFVEVPMLECFTHFTMSENLYGHSYIPPTGDYGYNRVLNPWRRPYPSRDGYVAIVPYSDRQWRQFFHLAECAEQFDDRFTTYPQRIANIKTLYALMETITPERTTEEWINLLRPHDIPVMPVHSLEQVQNDPHINAVNMFRKQHCDSVGEYVSIRHPVRYAQQGTPTFTALPQQPPPALGAHTYEVLQALGLDDKAVAVATGGRPEEPHS